MSKAVLLSIRPKWCELIASGEKTIEVRKTNPKIETPFKCYIYCTLSGSNEFFRETLGGDVADWNRSRMAEKKGNVIGEFVCDRIIEWHYIPDPDESADPGSMAYDVLTVDGEKTGLDYDDFEDYGKGAPLFGWHISNLVIYDEPKELCEFIRPSGGCCNEGKCTGCNFLDKGNGYNVEDDCLANFDTDMYSIVTRPPQSFCYVEELP